MNAPATFPTTSDMRRRIRSRQLYAAIQTTRQPCALDADLLEACETIISYARAPQLGPEIATALRIKQALTE